jgi:hypothetical protein
MRAIKILPSLLLACFLLFSSCKKDPAGTDGALVNISDDVANVTAVNLKQLMQKADFEQVKQMSFYNEMVSQAGKKSPALAAAFQDPAQSGIDFSKPLYIALEPDTENPEEMTGFLLFSLKNAGDFDKIMRSTKAQITSKGDLNLIDNNPNPVLAWNKKLFVMGFSNNGDALTEKVTSIFSLEKDKSIASNKDLRKALAGKHDIEGWMSTNALAANNAAGLALSMIDIDPEALKDNYVHSYANFEKGKIVGHADFFMNKALGKDFIGRFFRDEVKTDFTNYLPGENLSFVSVVALDPKGIDQFLSERPQSKGYADFVLKENGLKMKDMVAAFGGDLMVAGFSKGDVENSNILVATDLKDKAKAGEILKLAVQKYKLKEIEKDYYKITALGNEDFSITVNQGIGFLLVKDGLLFFATDQALTDQIKNGTNTPAASAKEVFKKLDRQTLASWFDFEAVKNSLGGMNGNWMDEMQFSINGKSADFILKTTDENVNSLKAVFQMIEEAYQQKKKDASEPL